MTSPRLSDSYSSRIAVVGMAGRFPGARTVDEFWANLRAGVESIQQLSDQELLGSGVDPDLLSSPSYVKAAAALDDVEMFDASFFGFSPRDASILDPQQRHFLECCWEALEDAGRNPEEFPGSVGVYAGSSFNSYLIHNLLTNPKLVKDAGMFLIRQTGNDKDVLATRASYHLNLTGPSLTIQTACSTSLVSIHMACQSLLNHECDMALAGGVAIEVPHRRGYEYRVGEIQSPDGHCRAFDANAAGTVFGNGAGVVVLRRLEDALADGDHVRAVILGTAINNDGSRKAGYLAPSVAGQAEVIADALAIAGVGADSISYVETHGTGTSVGDPIEISGLTEAFRQSSDRRGYCAIGSLKTNIGHLDAAAGVAGFIKTVLALEHRQIPPSLNFSQPNPLIDFASSPFYVNTRLRDWGTAGGPLRAGVTSLGIGGTNAHVVLEEAPLVEPAAPSRRYHLLTLSARTGDALDSAGKRLAGFLENNPSASLADVAFTLHRGRKKFFQRRAVVCQTASEAAISLKKDWTNRGPAGKEDRDRPVIFLFSGQGSQYVGMGLDLYETEPVFRTEIDRCSELLSGPLGVDLRQVLYPSPDRREEAGRLLGQTAVTQPAVFVIEYALAKLWESWGIRPSAMIGHSVGEFAAACLAGVMSLEDSLSAIATRGRIMQSLPAGGAMLAVALGEQETMRFIDGSLSLAAVNGRDQCVISGSAEALRRVEDRLEQDGVSCSRLQTSHAFHSPLMDNAVEPFVSAMRQIRLAKPVIPYLSNVTGDWIRADEASNPTYWGQHLRQPVRFYAGLQKLLQKPAILLEVGPGRVLAGLASRHPSRTPAHTILSSLRKPEETGPDDRFLLTTLGELWAGGASIDWAAFHTERRLRLPLPTYPFERKRYWIDPPEPLKEPQAATSPALQESDSGLRFYRPRWNKVDLPPNSGQDAKTGGTWLLFSDNTQLASSVETELSRTGREFISVAPGAAFRKMDLRRYEIRPGERADYDALLADLLLAGKPPATVLHFWALETFAENLDPQAALERSLDLCFYSLLFWAQSIGDQDISQPIRLGVVSRGLQQIAGERIPDPEKAVLAGPCKVIPKEFENISSRWVDLPISASSQEQAETAKALINELQSDSRDAVIAYRDGSRWAQDLEVAGFEPNPTTETIRHKGVYLITGGLGGVGLHLAEHLAKTALAKLILVGRTELPERSQWNRWLSTHSLDDSIGSKIRAVERLEALGAEVSVVRGDICDRDDARRIVQEATARFGAIHGVVHAAGVLEDGLIQLKSKANAGRVLNPKVAGTLALEEALDGANLDFLLLCSSISLWMAPVGQVDYVAASAFLDAFAQSRTANGRPVVAVDWARWSNVGMAVERSKPEGAIQTAAGNAKVELRHPFLETCVADTPQTLRYITELKLDEQWILSEHAFRGGDGLFPGTGYIEMAQALMLRHSGAGAVEIQDLVFMSPIWVGKDHPKRIEIALEKAGDVCDFSVTSIREPQSAIGDTFLEHVSGSVRHLGDSERVVYNLQRILDRCKQRKLDLEPERTNKKQASFIDFGPRFRCLKHIWFGEDEAVSFAELGEEFSSDLTEFHTHPALLDTAATGSAMFTIREYDQTQNLYIPASYKKITLFAPLPRRFYCHIRSKPENTIHKEVASFDITVLDESGLRLVEIEEFVVRRIVDTAILSDMQVRSGQETDRAVRSSRTEPRRSNLLALDPAKALDAFDLVLKNRLKLGSQVIVAPPGWRLEDINSGTKPRARASVGETPPSSGLHADGTAPAGEVEVRLVEWLGESLGMTELSVNDDFFDLGGDSLLAVRLFAKIKKTFGVELGLAKLFEARTIGALASLIRDQLTHGGPNTQWFSESPLMVRPAASGNPLSFAQERLWFLDKFEPDSSMYNLALGIKIQGDLNRTALKSALSQVVARHEVLRTTFSTTQEGRPSQNISAANPFTLHLVQPPGAEHAEKEAEGWKLLRAEAQRTFDLEHDCMLRAVLLEIDEVHLLLLAMHHIASDGWSLAVLLEEISELYRAYASGHAPLPELAIQYADFAWWQRQWLQGERLDKQLNYWKHQLSGAPDFLQLPADHPRPQMQTFVGAQVPVSVPSKLGDALQELCRRERVTPFMVLLAAFQTLLYRYSGQSDICVGSPIANRIRPEIEPLIGFFVNTLVFRSTFSDNPTFRQLLGRVRETALDAYAHQDLPFEKLVEAISPKRNMSYSPLFQVMFVVQNSVDKALDLPGLTTSVVDVTAGTAKFDLTLSLGQAESGLHGYIEYNTDLFEAATARRLAEHFLRLTESLIDNPDQAVSVAPFLTASDYDQLLGVWNRTETEYPVDHPLQQLIEAQTAEKSNEIAVTDRDQRLTYAELNARANQLAAHLRSMGVGPNVLVGVCVERSLDLVITLLAIVKSGGAYLPLDPTYPAERISALVEDSNVLILVTDSGFNRALTGFSGQIVRLDWDTLSHYPPENCAIASRPQDLAYVLYTSGSTGRPKGVSISRKALLNLLWGMRAWLDFSSHDVLMGVTTISFDIAGVDIWLPLLVGARLILADHDTATDGKRLQTEIEKQGVTFLQATPVTWKMLIDCGWRGNSRLKAVCTGEAMPRELVGRLFPLVGRLWNMYGPTETTIWSSGYEITSAEDRVLIGRPIANTQLYILDRCLSLAPIGVSGELYIGGDGLAEGYLNRPELTAERFIPNPFDAASGRRLYRTGDIARYLPDGNIECLGRNDDQIKVRGFRIEPEEIRAVLVRHAGVRDAIVVLSSSSSSEPRLIAYVEPRLGQDSVNGRELRDFSRRALPEYMVPSTFVFLDALPLTSNGKVNRRALPAPEAAGYRDDFVLPSNPTELALASIWEELLRVAQVSVEDDFFDLGGHSLLAVRLFSEVKKTFGLELPLATLFQAPTVKLLARVISDRGRSAPRSSLVPINSSGSKLPFYFVSGIGGHVLTFREGARHLGSDQPVYGLEPKRLLESELPFTTMQDIAAHYVREVREFQPEGPYLLGGYSFGGLVAFEMAQQLTVSGQHVAFLAIFDTQAPFRIARSKLGIIRRRTAGSWWHRLREISSSDDRAEIVKRIIEGRTMRIQERFSRLVYGRVPAKLQTVEGSQGFAAVNYVGRAYPGSVTLFRSEGRHQNDLWSQELGWEKFAEGGVEVIDVPGDHISVYSGEHLPVLASKLKLCLEHAQTDLMSSVSPTRGQGFVRRASSST